jgi:hypothetical protein
MNRVSPVVMSEVDSSIRRYRARFCNVLIIKLNVALLATGQAAALSVVPSFTPYLPIH